MEMDMARRFVCEAEWASAEGTHAKGRWPLSATDHDAAMDEMMALYEAKHKDNLIGMDDVEWIAFVCVTVDEAEWLALSGARSDA